MMKKILVLYFICLYSCSIFAQPSLPIPEPIQAAYLKGTRDVSGKPGATYWQNSANYNLKINFNPSTRKIKGVVDIVYFNNSPDTLTQLWFKLYPNLYKKGVRRKAEIDTADLGDGVDISSIAINGNPTPINTLSIEGTNMHITIDALGAGQSIKVKINYSYTLNKSSSVRTGQVDEGSFFIAYFFPRIAVYDDIDGWNKYSYDGEAEFYNDFSNFETAITIPSNYMAWATGDLLNAGKVLNPIVANRLQEAGKADRVIDVVTTADLKHKRVTNAKPFNTWQFKAQHITDFAFAVSNNYVVKSTSIEVDPKTGRRARVDAVFNPKHKAYDEVVDFSQKTVHAMSYHFPKWSYPFSHITVFDGLDEMEYPMMANINPIEKRYDAITTVNHEIFHTIFPFYVGINETKYGWMDEGWAAVAEWLIAPTIDSTFIGGAGVDFYSNVAGKDKPIMRVSHDLEGPDYISNTYVKPNLAYYYLKQYLGDELFTKALHHYINQWQGKHPMPFDFFYSMNEGSGKDLNWFWKSWFFDENSVDMAIKAVTKETAGFSIQIENIGGKPLPIVLTCTYIDGSIEKIERSIAAWEKGNSLITLMLHTNRVLQKVELGSGYVPDKIKGNNVFVVR